MAMLVAGLALALGGSAAAAQGAEPPRAGTSIVEKPQPGPAGARIDTGATAGLLGAVTVQGGTNLLGGAAFESLPSVDAVAAVDHPLGRYMPDDGPSFALLTTGGAGNAIPPNIDTDFGIDHGAAERGVHDLTLLRIDLNVPHDADCLSFDVQFASEEYPEFIGSRYNDAFVAELDATTWTYDEATATLHAPGNFATDADGHELTINRAQFLTDESTQMEYDGTTRLLSASTPITPGKHTLYLSLFDAADGIYDSAALVDNLRVGRATSGACRSGISTVDTDGDGISDDWERYGLDANGDGDVSDPGDVDLPGMSANPLRKDLYVEVDAMEGRRPSADAMTKVMTAFRAAPVTNPDGSHGISIHIDNGPSSLMSPGVSWGSHSRATDIPHVTTLNGFTGDEADWTHFDQLTSGAAAAERASIFHYALFADRMDAPNFIGMSRGIPASDFLVARGSMCAGSGMPTHCTPSPVPEAVNFMHELGHNLALRHGGADNVHHKPNYLSVMNYLFSGSGIPGADLDGIDYSRYGSDVVPALNEHDLPEDVGFGVTDPALAGLDSVYRCPDGSRRRTGGLLGGKNWDCGWLTGGWVKANINGDLNDPMDASSGPLYEVLETQNDWLALSYRGGSIGGFNRGGDKPVRTPKEEPEVQEVLAAAGDVEPPPAPATLDAIEIAPEAATLVASVRSGGAPAAVSFLVGRPGQLSSEVGSDAPAGGERTVRHRLSGLVPATTYEVTAVARTGIHAVPAAAKTFTTAPLPVKTTPTPKAAVVPMRCRKLRGLARKLCVKRETRLATRLKSCKKKRPARARASCARTAKRAAAAQKRKDARRVAAAKRKKKKRP